MRIWPIDGLEMGCNDTQRKGISIEFSSRANLMDAVGAEMTKNDMGDFVGKKIQLRTGQQIFEAVLIRDRVRIRQG